MEEITIGSFTLYGPETSSRSVTYDSLGITAAALNLKNGRALSFNMDNCMVSSIHTSLMATSMAKGRSKILGSMHMEDR